MAIAHEEDLENFLLSLRDCLERINRNEFPGNINFLEHFWILRVATASQDTESYNSH